MSKFKPFIITAAVAIIAIAVVSRVTALRKLVFNQTA
jgi:hypothetical protein